LILLYFRTLQALPPGQVRELLRHRLRRAFPEKAPEHPPKVLATRQPVPRVARARMPPTPGFLSGDFTAWGTARHLDLDRRWEAPDLGRSWSYPIQYFDGIPALALEANDAPSAAAIARFLERWVDAHPPGRGVAWDPYPLALRIVNWADTLQLLGDRVPESPRLAASLWTQAAWLHARLERHLFGTHLLKDAKALLMAAALFDDARARRWGSEGEALWRRELASQVQADGSHIEASIMYHGLALWDALDVLNWNLGSEALRAETRPVAQRMVDYLASVQTPAGEYPLFGDASYDAIPPPRELLAYAARLGLAAREPRPGLVVHADAGFAVWRDTRQFLIARVGGIGARQVAAHAHCDALSFEWHVDGVPFIVDSGVRSYEPGAARFASRRTRAHNTLQVDGREQHEIWGAFRLARRAQVEVKPGEGELEVRLVPWHDRRVEVVRRFRFLDEIIRIEDRVQGAGHHRAESRLHLYPDCVVAAELDLVRLERGLARAEVEFIAPHGVHLPDAKRGFLCERMGVPFAGHEIVIEGDTPFESECILKVGWT